MVLSRGALPTGVWDQWNVGTFLLLDIGSLPTTHIAAMLLFGP